MSEQEHVQAYFQERALWFDSIYAERKSPLKWLRHKLFHGVIERRFELAFEQFSDIPARTLLDVGCGSGRYVLRFAREGGTAVGIDSAGSMIELANRHATHLGIGDRCTFLQGEFMEHSFSESFDYVLGIGFFDYLREPVPFLRKMIHLAGEKAMISLPKKWTLRTGLRKMRLMLKHCPVFFYSYRDIDRLMSEMGPVRYQVVRLSRDYVVIIEP